MEVSSPKSQTPGPLTTGGRVVLQDDVPGERDMSGRTGEQGPFGRGPGSRSDRV